MTPKKSARLRPPERLRHGDFALRVPRDSDLAAIVTACQDSEIPRWTTAPTPYTDADGREFLRMCEEVWREGIGVIFAITDAEEDELIGTIGARVIEHSMGEVGYWLAREARGRGVATTALRALSGWCLTEASFERLQLLTEPDNLPSQRVAERAGYQREGLLRSYFLNKGKRRDVIIYSLLPSDLDRDQPGGPSARLPRRS